MQCSLHRLASGFALVGLISLVGAQARATQVPAAAALTLAFKYPAGRIQKFRLHTTGNMTLTPEGGLSKDGFTIGFSEQYLMSEKVLGNKDNTGTLTVKFDPVQVDLDVLGTQTIRKFVNGKVTTTLNGQPAPPDHPLVLAAKQADAPPPVTIRRSLYGQPMKDAGIAEAAGRLLGEVVLASLPDHPVKIGDSWTGLQKIVISVPGFPIGPDSVVTREVRLHHTLREIQTRDQHRQAIIVSTSESSGDEGEKKQGPAKLEGERQELSGVTHFDIDRGVVVSSAYDLELSLPLPSGAVGGNEPETIRLDGALKYHLSEVPEAAAKAAGQPTLKNAAPRKQASPQR